jgi:hypothetical protein
VPSDQIDTALGGAGFPPSIFPTIDLDQLETGRSGSIMVTMPGLPKALAHQAIDLNRVGLLLAGYRSFGSLLINTTRYKIKFVTILPNTPVKAARQHASDVLKQFSGSYPYGPVFRLSVGIAAFDGTIRGLKLAALTANTLATLSHPLGGIRSRMRQEIN